MLPISFFDLARLVCTVCTGTVLAAVRRVRTGVSFDQDVVQALDQRVELLKDEGVNRSEVVNAILLDYFEGNGSSETVLGVVGKRRVGKQR